MDEETLNWPVDAKYQDAIDLIKPEYCAVPLRLYHDEQFMEPLDTKEALQNALVEIHFTLSHTSLSNRQPAKDSFRANIEQIVVLKNKAPPTFAYRGDPCKGPVIVTTHSPPPSSP